MTNTYNSIIELIGNTPLVRLKSFKNAEVYAKLESFNPAGSSKDRIAAEMIRDGINNNKINKDSVIIEATSGNTGIGLAAVCASYGIKCIFVMPESMSIERRKLLSAYGAELVLTSAQEGMDGSIRKTQELLKEIPNSVIAGQFTNHSNPLAHYKTTGPEIMKDMDGAVDYFVCCVGTGGTISGTGKYLKENIPGIKIIGVEPTGSPVITQGVGGSHKIQGIGAGFIPETLDLDVVDEMICVTDEDAYNFTAELPKTEGILVGISSGAALAAAQIISKREEAKDKKIVVLLPDSGERYLSTEGLF